MDILPHYSKFDTDLWHYLAKTDKAIIMYGMGNGADKILAALDSFGISVSDFFASDGFVRGQSFHGRTVLSFSQIKEKYSDFIIIMSFGSRLSDVLDNVYALDNSYEMYAPDVPVSGECLFTLDYYRNNFKQFEKAFSLLADDESKSIFADIIRYKISGKIKYLQSAVSTPDFENKILAFDRYETFIDAGAYNGDTARKFVSDCKNAKTIYAIEPDRRNFKKLGEYAAVEEKAKIFPCRFGVWDKQDEVQFAVCGNRNSAIGIQNLKKSETVPLDTIDSLCASPDFIKYDVEGAEKQALLGSINTIRRFLPDMLISAYHRSDDLFVLPLLINENFPEYDIYLRRYEYVPAWDLNLYAVRRK